MSHRNIWISVAITMTILTVGRFLLRDAGEAPTYLLALVGIVFGIVLLHELDERELRQHRGD